MTEDELRRLRERMAAKMAEYRARPPGPPPGRRFVAPPNYDEEFFEGTRYLDSLAGPEFPAEDVCMAGGTELDELLDRASEQLLAARMAIKGDLDAPWNPGDPALGTNRGQATAALRDLRHQVEEAEKLLRGSGQWTKPDV